jgi:general secretion pathway protein F
VRFRYRAVSPTGEITEGEMIADTQRDVVGRLQAIGLIPLEAREGAAASLGSLLTRDLLQPDKRPPRRTLTAHIRQLGTLLRAGLPLDRALAILAEVAEKKTEAEVPRRLLNKIRGGSTLADAMAGEPMFPPFCVSMVRAGEVSGSLDQVLERLGDFLEKSEAARNKVKSALFYPAIVLGACLVSLAVLFAFVVPRFRPFFEDQNVTLPLITRALLGIGSFVEVYWWVPVVVAALATLIGLVLIRDPRHRMHWDALKLRLPLFGEMLRKAEIAQFGRILGTLLKNGVPLPNALKISGETFRNQVLARAIAGVTAGVKEGKGLTEPLARTQVFPPLALRLVRVGEEAARLDDMLLELATIYEWETAQGVERTLALLGPALTIGMGLIVALVIGSIMMAILSVYQLAV